MHRHCYKPKSESIFNNIVHGLFSERNMPNGSIIDVGALEGEFACFYADIARDRIVHALDPMHKNVAKFGALYTPSHPNMRPMVGALGERRATLPQAAIGQHKAGQFSMLTGISSVADKLQTSPPTRRESARPADEASSAIEVYVADDLFAPGGPWYGEALGFAHIDVEGSELAVLRGLAGTIRAYRPVLSVEVHVHFDPGFTNAILTFLHAHNYAAFLVEESCGMRMDCRNLLAVPKGGPLLLPSGARRVHTPSPTLDLALDARVLVPVDRTSIGSHAYPCCREGGECCAVRVAAHARVLGHPSCCMWWHVRGMLRRTMPQHAWVRVNNKTTEQLQPWISHAGPWQGG